MLVALGGASFGEILFARARLAFQRGVLEQLDLAPTPGSHQWKP
jgi:hypothetical protein